MHCPQCNKTISQKDQFCRFCGKPVIVTAPSTPPLKSGRLTLPMEYSDFESAEILARFEAPSGAWGAHLYTGSSQFPYQHNARPEGCPEWVEQADWTRWLRHGLVVWDHAQHQIGALLPAEALKLLETLRADATWQTQGIPIIERRETYNVFASRPKGSRKKKAEPEQSLTTSERVVEEQERLRLTGSTALEFYAYLQDRETQLRQMVNNEDARLKTARQYAFKVFLDAYQRHLFNEIDLSQRTFTWRRQEFPKALICEVPPDRATIQLSEDGLWWQPIIERPDCLKRDWERFVDLEQALDWVERMIPELRVQQAESAMKLAREQDEERAKWAALPKKDLTAFWISPAALEPTRITYRVIIELECEPYASQTVEISFGKHWHLNPEYYTPALLVRELKLNPSLVKVEQPVRSLGLYYVRSIVTFYEATLAAAQAQSTWEQSALLARFQDGKIIRARYGLEEVETDYCAWLGSCTHAEKPWQVEETRSKYLTWRARQATLLSTLDVNGYRAFLEMPFKYQNNQQLLRIMHELRAVSKYVPAPARSASERWLKKHPREVT